MTELCDIAFKYRTDKCPKLGLSFTPFYYQLFKDKSKEVKKVVEFGVGYPKSMFKVKDYLTGASLYMWREFFPNAQIFGVDISKEAQVKDDRIKTFVCDQMDGEKVQKIMKKIGYDIDLFVDDAAHWVETQVYLFQTVYPLLKEGAIYVIEDVRSPRHLRRALREIGYQSSEPVLEREGCKRYRNNLVVIKK